MEYSERSCAYTENMQNEIKNILRMWEKYVHILRICRMHEKSNISTNFKPNSKYFKWLSGAQMDSFGQISLKEQIS